MKKLGKTREARELLKLSLEAAVQDDFLMPFVENYRYLSEAYASLLIGGKNEFLTRNHRAWKTLGRARRALCCEKKISRCISDTDQAGTGNHRTDGTASE